MNRWVQKLAETSWHPEQLFGFQGGLGCMGLVGYNVTFLFVQIAWK